MKPFFVYILKCSDNSYYVGHTDDLDKRIGEHQLSEIQCYTSSRLPITVVYSQNFQNRSEAIEAERAIKNWSRKKKEALINGEFDKLRSFAKKKFPL